MKEKHDFNLDDRQRCSWNPSALRPERDHPGILHREREDAFPGTSSQKIWNMGIMNLTVPPSVGETAVDILTSALIIRELACGDAGIATSAMCK